MSKIRELGFWETLKTITHDQYHGNDIFTINMQLCGNLNTSLLNKAFKLCFERHPLLQSVINNNCFFKNLTWDDIPFVITDKKSISLEQLLSSEINTLFKSREALWRINILYDSANGLNHELCVTYHHAICDGVVILMMMNEVLSYYNGLHDNEEAFTIEALKVNKPQEQLLPNRCSWDEFLSNTNEYQCLERENGWKFQAECTVEKRVAAFKAIKIPISCLNNIEQLCKKNRVTLNAFFNALSLITRRQLDDVTYDAALCSWFSTRDYCKPNVPYDTFGYFVNHIGTRHLNISAKTTIWDLAQEYRTQIKGRLSNLSSFPDDYRVEQSPEIYNLDKWKAMRHFLYDQSVSYLSKLPIVSSRHITITGVNMAANWVGGMSGILCEIFIYGGDITVVFCYAEPLLERSWVEEYSHIFKEQLINIAEK